MISSLLILINEFSVVEYFQRVFHESIGTLVYALLYSEITSFAFTFGIGAGASGIKVFATYVNVNEPLAFAFPNIAVIIADPESNTVIVPVEETVAILGLEDSNVKYDGEI